MYDVRWLPESRQALADLWVATPQDDRDILADAVDDINRLLRDRPYDQGESRDPGFRFMIHGPLALRYAIDPSANVVYITRVSASRRRQ